MDKNKLNKRNELDTKYKWAIEDLFHNDEEWKKEFDFTKDLITKVKQYKGKLSDSPETLLEFYKLEDNIHYHFERVYVYANQKYHEDTSVSTYQGFSNHASNLEVQLSSALSFVIPEILEIPEETLKGFLTANDELKEYEFALVEIVRRKPQHALAGSPPRRGDIAEALRRLAHGGVDRAKLQHWLDGARVSPVLTAHPTEVQRKSILDVEREAAAGAERRGPASGAS
jgi:oligoendopeptidase F